MITRDEARDPQRDVQPCGFRTAPERRSSFAAVIETTGIMRLFPGSAIRAIASPRGNPGADGLPAALDGHPIAWWSLRPKSEAIQDRKVLSAAMRVAMH